MEAGEEELKVDPVRKSSGAEDGKRKSGQKRGRRKQRGEKMRIGNREFELTGHTYVMGILNVTPDSFSDGGRFLHPDKALFRVEEMLSEGMDILDIGGESTRPGYVRISDEEEIERTAPVIEAVKERFDVPISLDTYKSKVAKAGLLAGADLINDIWGLKEDQQMAEVISRAEVPCVLMHNRGEAAYQSFMEEIKSDLQESAALAQRAGIKKERIILDPGIGFAKSYEENLLLIRELAQLKELGFPLLLGCSRKSVIGLTLNLPAVERLEGTLVTTILGAERGCSFVRVHDVRENVRALRMLEAVLSAKG